MKASMSLRGYCYGSAPMQSFWASLKKQQMHHQHYKTSIRRELTCSTALRLPTTPFEGTVRWEIDLPWISLSHLFPI